MSGRRHYDREGVSMGKRLTRGEMDGALALLKQRYTLIGPRRDVDGGALSDTDRISYGEISALDELVLGEKSAFSPKEWLLPPRETLFRFVDGEPIEVPSSEQERILFVRPCDINGIERLDRIFLENGANKDSVYADRRRRTHFFMIECTEGFDSCFCVSMGANRTDDYACAVRIEDTRVTVAMRDERFGFAFEGVGESVAFAPEFIEHNAQTVDVPPPDEVSLERVVESQMWDEYSRRCIACGRCNTSCVTCSCFSMQDVLHDREGRVGERRRVWAGCHIDGFSDMAGGHSFRRKHGDRMRFKTLHKVYDFHKRFGEHMCVGCGRCDDVCPEYISFAECIRRYSKEAGGATDV